MAEDKKDTKQNAEAEDKPKRSRAAGTRKTSEASEKKPAPRRTRAKAKSEDKPESTEKAAEKAAAKPRRRTTRAKKDDAPKAARTPRAEPKAESKGQPKAQSKAEPKAKAADAKEPKEAVGRAPARRRGARPAPGERKGGSPAQRPVVTARAKYVRSSARKARLVIDHVRGKPIGEARALLRHSPRGVARDLERLLESAIANAENNHDLVGDDLLVKEIYADEGPTLKRFRARAQGRAYRIRKRTSHLTVALTPKE